jgi:hypothetical protein
MKRLAKSGGDVGNAYETIPALTAECIERLQRFSPGR